MSKDRDKRSAPRDWGGDGGGKPFAVKGSTVGVCVACGRKKQLPLRAWSRRSRVTCPACGALMEPSNYSQSMRPEIATVDITPLAVRRCAQCNAKLNSHNLGDLCSPCKNRVVPRRY